MNKRDKQFILDELEKYAYQVGWEVGTRRAGGAAYKRVFGSYIAYKRMAIYADIEGLYEDIEAHPEYERGVEDGRKEVSTVQPRKNDFNVSYRKSRF